jgi:hypothetical protein
VCSVANLADFPQHWACLGYKSRIIFTICGLLVFGLIFAARCYFSGLFFSAYFIKLPGQYFVIVMIFCALTVPVVVEKSQEGLEGTSLVAENNIYVILWSRGGLWPPPTNPIYSKIGNMKCARYSQTSEPLRLFQFTERLKRAG